MSNTPRCPGQNLQFWTFDDIYDIECPFCGVSIEFWKDEPVRICPGCSEEVRNPKIDLGCAKWCPHAEECLGRPIDMIPDAVIDRLIVLIKRHLNTTNRSLKRARLYCDRAERYAAGKAVSMCVVKAAALLIGAAENQDKTYDPVPNEKEILIQAGIDNDLIETIQALINAIFANRQLDSPEFAVIEQAMKPPQE